jgi:GNAT superfamily N-acetyltransferase
MTAPFIIFGLGRCRTTWLSRYLTYGSYHCGHDEMRHIRSMADVRSWLAQDCTGTVETNAARWWRLIRHLRPDIKMAVIRRPVAEVVDSYLRLDMRGVCTFDRDRLTRELSRQDRALDRIERQPGVLSISFANLSHEATCARLFEHCLPHRHDHDHWFDLSGMNIQSDVPNTMRHYLHHQPQMLAAAKTCRRAFRRTMGASLSHGEPDPDGVVIRRETLAAFERDGQALMAAHCLAVGEPEDQWRRKNWPMFQRWEDADSGDILTARVNGRMLGYLIHVVGQSAEDASVLTATQIPWFVSPDAKGLRLGWRLQQAAINVARARGVKEVYQRAGTRGDGPRLGVIYRRMGAEEFGTLYKLKVA